MTQSRSALAVNDYILSVAIVVKDTNFCSNEIPEVSTFNIQVFNNQVVGFTPLSTRIL